VDAPLRSDHTYKQAAAPDILGPGTLGVGGFPLHSDAKGGRPLIVRRWRLGTTGHLRRGRGQPPDERGLTMTVILQDPVGARDPSARHAFPDSKGEAPIARRSLDERSPKNSWLGTEPATSVRPRSNLSPTEATPARDRHGRLPR
jgi:hypothetical protein